MGAASTFQEAQICLEERKGEARRQRTSFDSAEVQTIQLTQADLQELFVPWAFPGMLHCCIMGTARPAEVRCQVIAPPVSFSSLFSGADEQAAASASSRERARGLGESECRVAPAQLKASRSRIATNTVPQCISKAISLVLNYWKRMMIEHPFQVLPSNVEMTLITPPRSCLAIRAYGRGGGVAIVNDGGGGRTR